MVEKEVIFSSKIKNTGPVNFKEFYRFCYDWLSEETNLIVVEEKYVEKLVADYKNLDIVWNCFRKITDYFKFEIKVTWRIIGLKEIEVQSEGKKIKTDTGAVEIKVKGTLVRDYESKFERTGFMKFLRAVYEKWVIYSRVEQYEDKLVGDCDEFLDQAKAYLDLEGQKAGIIQI